MATALKPTQTQVIRACQALLEAMSQWKGPLASCLATSWVTLGSGTS